MGFFLFLLVNATLFLRPSELFPGLATWKIYETLIIGCFIFSFSRVLEQLSLRDLESTPITLGVFILLVCCGMSHVMQLDMKQAADSSFSFLKVVVYYLLLVALVNTPGRIRIFLYALGFFVMVMTLIAVLRYYEVIALTPSPTKGTTHIVEDYSTSKIEDHDDPEFSVRDEYVDRQTDETTIVNRLRGTGIFMDPNDLCLALVFGLLICLQALNDPHLGVFRLFALAPMGLFLFALRLTASRGGLLGLLAGLAVLFLFRFGWRRALVVGGVTLPVIMALFAGRMTDISATEGTGQSRLQIWRDGMVLLKESPFFGVGMDRFHLHSTHVAHNSFLHGYTELGIFGGTIFLGLFLYAFWALHQVRKVQVTDADMRRLLPFILAMVAGYATGIFSLSNTYVVPTYTILGLATAFLRVVLVYPPLGELHVNGRMVLRLGAISLLFLVCMDLSVRLLVG